MDDAFDVFIISLVNPRSHKFSPMFPSQCFVLLNFIFNSMRHFELIFAKGIKSMSGHLFHMDVQFL